MSEGATLSHYYDSTGTLHAHVERADGKGLRDATLADARKEGWLPSCTTILSLLAKPGLVDWMIDMGIQQARTSLPGTDTRDIRRVAFQAVDDAAAFGTAVHAGISAGLKGETYWPTDVRVRLVLDGFWPWLAQSGIKADHSEVSFANCGLGYAGTADILGSFNGRPVLADFKTQDGDSNSDLAFYDPDHPLQLAGYSMGLGLAPDYHRMSIIISRTKPGLVACKVWHDNERYDAAFMALLETWFLLKSYDPRQAAIPDASFLFGSDNIIAFPGKEEIIGT